MIGEIIKTTKNNFNTTYTIHEPLRRSTRTVSSSASAYTKTQVSNNSPGLQSLLDYHHCYVEDYMSLPSSMNVILLLPLNNPERMALFQEHLDEPPHFILISFGKKESILLDGCIQSSLFRDRVISGIQYKDIVLGFVSQNYGSHVSIGNCGQLDPLLVTWDLVLKGKDLGLKVWHQNNLIRDPFRIFKNRRRCHTTELHVLSSLHEDVFGDSLQTFFADGILLVTVARME